MTNGATNETNETKTPETSATPEAPKPSAQQPSAAQAKTAPEEKSAPEPKSPRELVDGEDELDEKQPYQISGAALKKRLTRYSKSQLKEHFGTTDPEEIKSKLAKLAKLEADAEEARKAKLSEEEKMKEELAREKARAEAAEARAAAAEDKHIISVQERRVSSLASKFIDEDLLEDAMERFANHLRKNLSPREVAKLKDTDVAEWFEQLAKDKPKFAKSAPPASGDSGGEKKPSKALLNNGVGGDKRPAPKPGSNTGAIDWARVDPKHPQAYTRAQMKAFGLP
jgi:hypothetical protein